MFVATMNFIITSRKEKFNKDRDVSLEISDAFSSVALDSDLLGGFVLHIDASNIFVILNKHNI